MTSSPTQRLSEPPAPSTIPNRTERAQRRRQRVAAATADTGGVIARWTLAEMGVTHDDIRHEVEAGRWHVIGNQTVVPHTGAVSIEGRRWSAVWETGRGVAAIGGVTALQAAGLKNFTDDAIHVSVFHRCTVKKLSGGKLHKVIRRLPDELVGAGLPRTRPAVAALRAAYWAVSDRQAALLLLMTVQQRLATPDQLKSWSKRLRGRKLPEPTRQAVVQGERGRMYLDVRLDGHALVVEIDGVHHREGLQVSADNLGRNEVTLRDDKVLRIDVLGLRLHEDEFMGQVARGLRHTTRDSAAA